MTVNASDCRRIAAETIHRVSGRSHIDRAVCWMMRAVHDVLVLAVERGDHDMVVESVTIAGRVAVIARERCDDRHMADVLTLYVRAIAALVGYPTNQIP